MSEKNTETRLRLQIKARAALTLAQGTTEKDK
jgi:hypothetical protein